MLRAAKFPESVETGKDPPELEPWPATLPAAHNALFIPFFFNGLEEFITEQASLMGHRLS